MQEIFLKHTQINKTLSRFNKIRAYHNKCYNNLLPIKVLKKYAHNYQQIQLNTNFHFNAIIMDIDNGEFDYLVAGSRHIHLFELLRRYGYNIATKPNLKEKLIKKAEEINLHFSDPIKTRYIVNSVYSFCEKNQNNFRQNQKKVMKFKKIRNLSLREYKEEVKLRQSLSAKRTTTIKKQKTAIKIKVAIDRLFREKKSLNVKNLAKYAKVSVSTIRRNKKIVDFFILNTFGFIRSIRLIVQRAQRLCTKCGMRFYWYVVPRESSSIQKLE